MDELTLFEVGRLEQCEAVIERGLKTFTDVGNALLEIRDSKLYRREWGTFEEYCRDRWSIERAHAYRLMDSARVVMNLSPIGDILPATESQARPLAKFEPEQQQYVWQQVIDTAPVTGITAAHVQAVVDEVTNKPHVTNNSGNNEWYTPIEYIDAARRVMGVIDLDPASSLKANETVRAIEYFTEQRDGLRQPWAGRVWMNPPYASELIGHFCDRLVYFHECGDVKEAVVLVNNATETAWFGKLITQAKAVVFTRGRVRFIDMDGRPSGAPLQGQAVLYFGDNAHVFLKEFSGFGWGCLVWNSK